LRRTHVIFVFQHCEAAFNCPNGLEQLFDRIRGFGGRFLVLSHLCESLLRAFYLAAWHISLPHSASVNCAAAASFQKEKLGLQIRSWCSCSPHEGVLAVARRAGGGLAGESGGSAEYGFIQPDSGGKEVHIRREREDMPWIIGAFLPRRPCLQGVRKNKDELIASDTA
jgi:hypothetical protein